MSSVEAPKSWQGTFVSTLDAMLFIREHVAKTDSVLVFLGCDDVRRFASLAAGIHLHLFLCGAADPGHHEFLKWLRERHSLSSGAWEEKFLLDAGGDHHAAIRRFLDECVEFWTTRRPDPR